jgi:hypothetical protein
MPRPDPAEEARLRRLSARLAACCVGAAMLMPGLVAVAWGFGGASGLLSGMAGRPIDVTAGPVALTFAAALTLVPALLLSAAFLAARRALLAFAAGAWFGAATPIALRAFGRWTALAGLAGLVLPTALGLALTMGAPAGERVLTISVGSGTLTAVLTGTVVWALGHVWARAAALRAELDGFV